MTFTRTLSIALLGLLFGALGFLAFSTYQHAFGSVVTGSEYAYANITSTNASSSATTQLRTGFGTLGQVVVASTSPDTVYSQLVLYDATSTMATSSASVIAKFGKTGVSQGTYTFDTAFVYGLKAEVPADFDGSFTISVR